MDSPGFSSSSSLRLLQPIRYRPMDLGGALKPLLIPPLGQAWHHLGRQSRLEPDPGPDHVPARLPSRGKPGKRKYGGNKNWSAASLLPSFSPSIGTPYLSVPYGVLVLVQSPPAHLFFSVDPQDHDFLSTHRPLFNASCPHSGLAPHHLTNRYSVLSSLCSPKLEDHGITDQLPRVFPPLAFLSAVHFFNSIKSCSAVIFAPGALCSPGARGKSGIVAWGPRKTFLFSRRRLSPADRLYLLDERDLSGHQCSHGSIPLAR